LTWQPCHVAHGTLSLDRFENRNGVISWRVSGWLAGVRIRKNLKTHREAAAEKASLEIKALQQASGVRLAIPFLTDDQPREAKSLLRRIAGTVHHEAWVVLPIKNPGSNREIHLD
jgi:hypothetical protein